LRPDPLILAFDTSAAHCAAALLSGDRLLAIRHEEMDKGQAERLIPLLDEVLGEAGATWSDLAALAVGTGPGNFTGVRIAVAAARGLALSLGIPAIGVTTLDARAFALPRPLTVVEDARRGEVYVYTYSATPDAARVMPLAGLADLGPAPHLAGSAAGAAAAVAGGTVLPQPVPLVEAIARIAATRIGRDNPRPAPFYLRGADAAPPSDPPPRILAG
jgi:tRNA threonylcarbamoyl adenosine modification protein YeaZ